MSKTPGITPSSVLIKRLNQTYLRPHVKVLAIAVVLMIVDASATVSMAKLIEPVMDKIFQAHDRAALWGISILVITAFTARGFASYGHNVLMNSIGQKIVGAIQMDMFGHLLKADLSYFHANASGKLISRMTNDVGLMRHAVAEALTGLGRNVLTLISLIGLMFYQDWILASYTFAIFPIAGYLISRTGKNIQSEINASRISESKWRLS